MKEYVRSLQELGQGDIALVGGKNASLGEMIAKLESAHVRVPGGFATTTDAYQDFIAQAGIHAAIEDGLSALDVDDIAALNETAESLQELIRATPFPERVERSIREAWLRLSEEQGSAMSVAVRSSATAEDLPDASFAGQQETYLNVSGVDAVLDRIRDVYASLFNARAIAYRDHQGFAHHQVSISAGVQRMVRSDLAASGVMFTLDTESGFREVVFITAAYGLGETVVQGAVNPDEFYVYKPNIKRGLPAVLRRNPGSKRERMIYAANGQGVAVEAVPRQAQQCFCIGDDEVTELARAAVAIEQHYGQPMDIEWAKDGNDGLLYIVQARPETVQHRSGRILRRYRLREAGEVLINGRSIGQAIGAGKVRVIDSIEHMDQLLDGEVLVAEMTDPDWEPVMKRAAAIVTNRGGRTCHAAIIARELGVPAIVGCGDATGVLPTGQAVTVSCAEGETGLVYRNALPFDIDEIALDEMPDKPVRLMMNVANPDRAFAYATLPNDGVGLARLEFIINRMIGIHPQALLEYECLPSELRQQIEPRIAAYRDPVSFYVERLAEGIATITAAFAPAPVIVRLSDFKSNEYANLLGGDRYEPDEENPMIGFRGASRYLAESFRACFELECRAIYTVRDVLGLENLQIMIPFVRTLQEAAEVSEILQQQGLVRGERGLKVLMMCEIPSNALLAEQFLQYFDGFSIGSNDMTQLTLGLDRDSALVSERFDERDPAVRQLLALAIDACKQQQRYVGICGQGPSDHPDLAQWLVEQGIDSLSLNPDSMIETWLRLSRQTIPGERDLAGAG